MESVPKITYSSTEKEHKKQKLSETMKVTPSEPVWVSLLKTTRIGDILDPNRPVVKVQYHEYVGDILKKLAEANVLAAVVSEPNGSVWGFVDVLDLMIFALECAKSGSLTIDNLKWEGQCFSRQSSGLIANISQSNPYFTLTYDNSLWECVKYFAEEVHRIAIVEEDTGRVVNVIAQSDIVKFIAENGPWIGSKMVKPIQEAGLAPLGVATVLDDVSVLNTLRFMNETKVSGVPVVDKRGRMVANFSATDLLGLTEESFIHLTLSVKDYLNKIHGFPKPPVVCKMTDTVEIVLYKLVVHKVHRIYIVDDDMAPIGVITLTDIMRMLLEGEHLLP